MLENGFRKYITTNVILKCTFGKNFIPPHFVLYFQNKVSFSFFCSISTGIMLFIDKDLCPFSAEQSLQICFFHHSCLHAASALWNALVEVQKYNFLFKFFRFSVVNFKVYAEIILQHC
jgi:hypothetical protein